MKSRSEGVLSLSVWVFVSTETRRLEEEKYSWSTSCRTVSAGGGSNGGGGGGGDDRSAASEIGFFLSLSNDSPRSSLCSSSFLSVLSNPLCKKYNGSSSHFSNSSINPFRLISEFRFAF